MPESLKMTRYMVRRGSTGQFWMIWDREKRAPALVDGRAMIRLTEAEAELVLSNLTGSSNSILTGNEPLATRTWELTYGGAVALPCANEGDANVLARELLKKGHTVSAKTIEGFFTSEVDCGTPDIGLAC